MVCLELDDLGQQGEHGLRDDLKNLWDGGSIQQINGSLIILSIVTELLLNLLLLLGRRILLQSGRNLLDVVCLQLDDLGQQGEHGLRDDYEEPVIWGEYNK